MMRMGNSAGVAVGPLHRRWLAATNLFLVDGILAIVFAGGFLLLAPQLLGLYGIDVTAGSVLMTRVLACFLLAAGITQLGARGSADSPAARWITLGYLACDALATGVSAMAVSGGAANRLGIGLVAIFLALACWRAYLVFEARSRAGR